MNIALLLAAGNGTRAESRIPKQYHRANRKMMLRFVFDKLVELDRFDCILISAQDAWMPNIVKELADRKTTTPVAFCQQGATVQFSILNALTYYNNLIGIGSDDKVLLIEASRPFVSKQLIASCIDNCVDNTEGVVPVIPTEDAIIIAREIPCNIEKMLNTKRTFIPQMPQCYKVETYYNAHSRLTDREIGKITDPCQLAYATGLNLKLIPGEIGNKKIITYGDLYYFKHVNTPNRGINPPPIEIFQ